LSRLDVETQLQIACVNLCQYVLPKGAIVHHSHNEGRRSKRDAAIAKAMGQRAGFADLMIMHDTVTYLIEFKTATGRQSSAQREFEDDARANGFRYAIVRSVDEFTRLLSDWGLAVRKIGNAAPILNVLDRPMADRQ
jgi:hypothetical protein